MKTEVRKEHGDWIVFVDDNPQFSFMYREEAEKVRNMVEALVECFVLLRKMPANEQIINACVYAESSLEKAGCKL